MICVFIIQMYDGSTRRLTESGFMWGFLWFYGEVGNRTCFGACEQQMRRPACASVPLLFTYENYIISKLALGYISIF